jgi:formylglycine-generating enzyme required for sulfatase activity
LNAALVNTGQFRANVDAETQRTVSSCVGEMASATSKRACELSMSNVAVDWLMMLSSRRIGGDWKWGVAALSPTEGGAQKWGGDEKPAGVSDRVQAAYEACDLLGKKFACAQGVATACAGEPMRTSPPGPPAPVPSAKESATLEVIRVTPSPALVFVDGREVGNAPNQFDVTPGQHTVELRAPGQEPWTGTFEVAAGKTFSLPAVTLGLRPAVLSVSSNIGDASILVDGREVGRTRRNEAVEVKVAPDARKVEVQRDGYASVAESLALTAGGRSSVTMQLEVASAAPKPADCPAGYVRIAPGTFTMGSPPGERDRDDDETQRNVTITRAFCMKATEVTQGEWQAVMGSNPSYFKDCGANCPVEKVSWDDAVGYANALSRREGLPECYAGSTFSGLGCKGYRLPTEAEWEYAARAGTTGATYGNLGSVAWYDENSGSATHPVGQKRPNAWGLYDMLGNVWEWTGDWYGEYSGTVTDPTGPARGSTRVVRGGSWYSIARGARAAFRGNYAPVDRDDDLGFRLSRTAP